MKQIKKEKKTFHAIQNGSAIKAVPYAIIILNQKSYSLHNV